jgi:hypothetical protein
MKSLLLITKSVVQTFHALSLLWVTVSFFSIFYGINFNWWSVVVFFVCHFILFSIYIKEKRIESEELNQLREDLLRRKGKY